MPETAENVTESVENLGYDAECDYCDWRLSDDPDEPGPFTEADAKRSARWHKQDCEPEVKVLTPDDLAKEREALARLKEKYPEAYGAVGAS